MRTNTAVSRPAKEIAATSDAAKLPRPLLAQITKLDLLFIFLIGLFGFYGGTPYDHPDFLTAHVGTVLKSHGNPKYFHYGSLVIYALCAVYGLTYGVLRLAGVVHSTGEYQKLIDTNFLLEQPLKISAFLPGHIFTVLCSLVAIYSVFWLTLRLTQQRLFAYIAIIFLATSYQWFIDSHFLTVDVPMGAFIIASIALAFAFCDRLTLTKYAALLGACTGIVAGTKYPGGLIALPLCISLLLLARQLKVDTRQQRRIVGVFILSALGVFLLTNPFVLLDFGTFWRDFSMEALHARVGHPGFISQSFFFHSRVSLYDSVGLLGIVLSLAGLEIILFSSSFKPAEKILLLLFPFLHFILISASALAFQRYATPLLPFMAIFTALALAKLEALIPTKDSITTLRTPKRIGIIILAVLLIAPNTVLAIRTAELLRAIDSRELLVKLVGDKQFGPSYVSNYLKLSLKGHLSGATDQAQVELLFLDSFTHDRDLYEECRIEPQLLAFLNNFDRVLVINPFDKAKAEVPFSPQSTYSPALPDLSHRKIAGPYIEIYFASTGRFAAEWNATASDLISVLPADQGYYYRQLPISCKDIKSQSIIDLDKAGYKPLTSGVM